MIAPGNVIVRPMPVRLRCLDESVGKIKALPHLHVRIKPGQNLQNATAAQFRSSQWLQYKRMVIIGKGMGRKPKPYDEAKGRKANLALCAIKELAVFGIGYIPKAAKFPQASRNV